MLLVIELRNGNDFGGGQEGEGEVFELSGDTISNWMGHGFRGGVGS